MEVVKFAGSVFILAVAAFLFYAVYLSQCRAWVRKEIKRQLPSLGLNARECQVRASKLMIEVVSPYKGGPSGFDARTQGGLKSDPLVALMLYIHQMKPEDLEGLTIGTAFNRFLPRKSTQQAERLEFFVAAAEFSDTDYKRLHRNMTSLQQQEADEIRSKLRGRLSERINGMREEERRKEERDNLEKQWREERRTLPEGTDLTGWLRDQGPEIWHDVCTSVEWDAEEAELFVPFVEWVVTQPDLDRGGALVLLKNALFDGIHYQPYQTLDCPRNVAWMKSLHEGLLSQRYAPRKFAVPRVSSFKDFPIFDPDAAGEWYVPEMDLTPIWEDYPVLRTPAQWKGRQPLEYAIDYNKVVETLAAWQARRAG